LITLFIWLFFWALNVGYLKFTVYGFAGIAVILTIILIFSVLKTFSRINLFLNSFVVNEPFPKFRSGYAGDVFTDLEQSLNKIARSYGNVKAEMEESYQFLEELIGQIDTMIMVYRNDGSIKMANPAAKKLFNDTDLTNLEKISPNFNAIKKILKNQNLFKPEVIKHVVHNEPKKISIKQIPLKLRGVDYTMAVLQDISYELDKEEVESWEKLIRILRHEIINSITPITTVASTLVSSFEEESLQTSIEGPHHKTIVNTYKGLKAIDKRGSGLIDFVKSYKDISATIKPEFKTILVASLISQIGILVEQDCKSESIDMKISLPEEDLFVIADEKQIIQVMLNLVKNSIEALEGEKDKKIIINAYKEEKNTIISVYDNGKGIDADETENIFVPFYTTKPNGSGIGLSISKSILQKHGASMIVRSEAGKETVVLLRFM